MRHWLPREPYTKFKIKTLLPEQKTINIKKNGQVIRTVTVRRKTKKFTDRWVKFFFKKCWHRIGKITILKQILSSVILQIDSIQN